MALNYWDQQKNEAEMKRMASYKRQSERQLQESADAARAERQRIIAESKGEREQLEYYKKSHKDKVQKLAHFNESAIVVGITECLNAIVQKSLLLDVELFEQLNPTFKSDLKETVRSFLENDEINNNITNPNTLAIIEAVSRRIPEAESGIYLTEEEVAQLFTLPDMDIDAAIDELSYDVKDRVADIVDNDQKIIDGYEKEIGIEDDRDGTLVNEHFATGIIETLALNESMQVLSEGKNYNSELAIANAIALTTVLETLDASGIVLIGQEGYKRLLENCRVRKESDKRHSEMNRYYAQEAPREKVVVKEANVPVHMRSELNIGEHMQSFADWKKEKQMLAEGSLAVTPTSNESLNEDCGVQYVKMNGLTLNESEMIGFLQRKGFDLNVDDFNSAVAQCGFRRK